MKVMHLGETNEQRLISCLHLSQDKASRHLAVATFSDRESVLQIWRIGDPPELDRNDRRRKIDSVPNVIVDQSEVLIDQYKSKRGGRSMWTIKVCIEYDYPTLRPTLLFSNAVEPLINELDGSVGKIR